MPIITGIPISEITAANLFGFHLKWFNWSLRYFYGHIKSFCNFFDEVEFIFSFKKSVRFQTVVFHKRVLFHGSFEDLTSFHSVLFRA